MSKILKVQKRSNTHNGRPVNVVGTFGRLHKETIRVLVDKLPNRDDVVFKWYSNKKFLYGEKDGFCYIYKYNPRTTDSFGGRTIELNVEGQLHSFKGTLWHPSFTSEGFEEIADNVFDISITDDREAMGRSHTFYSANVTKEMLDKLLNKLKEQNHAETN